RHQEAVRACMRIETQRALLIADADVAEAGEKGRQLRAVGGVRRREPARRQTRGSEGLQHAVDAREVRACVGEAAMDVTVRGDLADGPGGIEATQGVGGAEEGGRAAVQGECWQAAVRLEAV